MTCTFHFAHRGWKQHRRWISRVPRNQSRADTPRAIWFISPRVPPVPEFRIWPIRRKPRALCEIDTSRICQIVRATINNNKRWNAPRPSFHARIWVIPIEISKTWRNGTRESAAIKEGCYRRCRATTIGSNGEWFRRVEYRGARVGSAKQTAKKSIPKCTVTETKCWPRNLLCAFVTFAYRHIVSSYIARLYGEYKISLKNSFIIEHSSLKDLGARRERRPLKTSKPAKLHATRCAGMRALFRENPKLVTGIGPFSRQSNYFIMPR